MGKDSHTISIKNIMVSETCQSRFLNLRVNLNSGMINSHPPHDFQGESFDYLITVSSRHSNRRINRFEACWTTKHFGVLSLESIKLLD